jgi:hypothetical protein
VALWLTLAFAVPFLTAVAAFPLLVRGSRLGWLALVASYLVMGASPGLIPSGRPVPRFLAAVSAVVVAVKLFDVLHDVRRGAGPSWRQFATFLTDPFVHVRRRLADEPRPSRRADLLKLASGLVGLVVGIVLLTRLFRVDWERWTFAVEHVSKVLAFFVAVLSGLTAAAALWRLTGGAARDFMDAPAAARTPADFWRRYNRNMQQFFYEDVFKPAGGLRAPVRTTLFVFAVSALMHEYLFGIAIGRVQGYQTAFFLLQGVAVASTARVKPRGWRAVPWGLGTLAFNLASSVLFFASINGLVAFYSHGLPAWLEGW